MGGDEFILLIQEIAHVDDVDEIAQKIVEAVRKPFVLHDQKLHITTSIGISIYPTDGEDAETLIRKADIAMYRAKEMGKNTHQLYTPVLDTAVKV